MLYLSHGEEETTTIVQSHRDETQYIRTPMQSECPDPKSSREKVIDARAYEKYLQKKCGHTSMRML